MDYYGPMMYGYGWGIVGSLLWLAFFVFVAVLAYRLIKNHGIGSNPKSDPLDIAKQRYAKGEITKDQYEDLKKDLK